MPPFQVLLLCAMASGAVALGSAWAAWRVVPACSATSPIETVISSMPAAADAVASFWTRAERPTLAIPWPTSLDTRWTW